MLLKKGARGTDVKYLQYGLRIICINTGNIDGVFGAGVYNGVKKFQSKFGLSADGIVGDGTWNKLKSQVKPIQEALRKHNYSIAADGVAGPATYDAILHYQRNKGLTADGMVGSATWRLLSNGGSGSSTNAKAIFPLVNTMGLLRYLPVHLFNCGTKKSVTSCDGRVTITGKVSLAHTIGNADLSIDLSRRQLSGASVYSGNFSGDFNREILKGDMLGALNSVGVKLLELKGGTLRAKLVGPVVSPNNFAIIFEYCTVINGITVYQIIKMHFRDFNRPQTPSTSNDTKRYIASVVFLGAIIAACFLAPATGAVVATALTPYVRVL